MALGYPDWQVAIRKRDFDRMSRLIAHERNLSSEASAVLSAFEELMAQQQFPLMTCELYVTMAADSSLSVSTLRCRFLKRLWRTATPTPDTLYATDYAVLAWFREAGRHTGGRPAAVLAEGASAGHVQDGLADARLLKPAHRDGS
jgi:hypothetical protein